MDDISDLISAAQRIEICLASLPGFISPKQVRTQKKTDLIISAAAHLLRERRFCDISVQDIAFKAGCAITAIYARFHDKDALLPAVHLIFLEQNRILMKTRIVADNYKNRTINDFSYEFIELQENFYLKNENFFKAAARGEGRYVFIQMAAAVKEWAADCNEIVSDLLNRDPQETLKSLEFAISHIGAVYRDQIITGDPLAQTNRTTLAALFSMMLKIQLPA